jgi:DNA end-binding protein Ku
MARAIWSGSISFGLVNIPIKVVGAVSDKDIHFNQLHEQDGARIKYKKVCSKDGEEVPAEDIVRGYEIRSGQYVTFTDEELEAADPKASRTVEIQDFVDLPEIDPAFFDKPYYLVPDKAAGKAYALLLAALRDTNKVGVARVVMHGKENLVALRALEGVLMMETMHFAEEVTPPEKIAEEVKAGDIAVDKRQLELAKQIIESLSSPFEPEKYENTHRKKVLELIEQKAEGRQVVVEPEVPVSVRTADLLGALEKSLAAARTRHGEKDGKEPGKKVVAHPRKRGGGAA